MWNADFTLRWRHNGHGSVSNHQHYDCLLNHLFQHRSKETSKLRVTGLCVGNSPGTDEFPAQMASNTENVSIWWRHHDADDLKICTHVFDQQLIFAPVIHLNHKIPSYVNDFYLVI